MTLDEAQKSVDAWIKNHGVRYFNELTNLAILTEEVGEVARIMATLYGEKSAKSGQLLNKEKLSEEIADVLFVLMAIANQTGIDLDNAFRHTLKKKTERDHERHRVNTRLYNEPE